MIAEVTQEDREAAASVAVLAEMRELILSGRADHHAEPWAIHRHRGKLEGARLAIEAAAGLPLNWYCPVMATNHENETYRSISATIRALSPAKIVGG